MLKRFFNLYQILMVSVLIPLSLPAYAELRIGGSSTVYPFATVVAEQVSKKTGQQPIIEATGSGSGLRSICKKKVDVANASRRIKASELKKCHQANIDLVEFIFGRDGITFSVSNQNEKFNIIQLKDIYLALAKNVPVNGQIIANPYRQWHDINPALPAIDILVYGPPPTSGTRDAFEVLGMEAGAKKIDMLAKLEKSDKIAFEKIAKTLREDGFYIEGGENDNLLVRKLRNEPNAIAIFGFSYLDNNQNLIRGIKINGVEPSFDNILDGNYPVSRSLYFYARKNILENSEDLRNYVKAFISLKAIGEEGYLADKGVIPLNPQEFKKQIMKLNSFPALTLKELETR